VLEQYGPGAGIQALAGGAETPALEPHDFEVQRFIPGLLEIEFSLQPLQQIAQVLKRIG
jgi:hypothetical protein